MWPLRMKSFVIILFIILLSVYQINCDFWKNEEGKIYKQNKKNHRRGQRQRQHNKHGN